MQKEEHQPTPFPSSPEGEDLREIGTCRQALPLGGVGEGFYMVHIHHHQTVQLGIFRLAPFSMTGTGVALQRLIALGDEACRKDPCREFLLQLRFLVVQLVIGCTPLLLGLHLGRHPADFLDLLRDEGVVYRLIEVFAGCRYAVRISFLFEVKHIFKGCAISVYAQSAGL